MRDLLIAAGADPVLRAYCTIGDLDWWRSIHADPAHIHHAPLWFVDGALAGFIWPNDNNADLLVHPAHREIEAVMLAWVEAHLAAADAAGEMTVTTWAMTQDTLRTRQLEALGYIRTATHLIFHTADLTRPIPAPDLPPGFMLRSFRGEPEIEARVDVHRSAFHPSRMTVEKHRRAMASPTYRQTLDLLVIAPDGAPAACCIVWYDAVNRFGVFEPVGTHQDYRRLGLAKAVLQHGMRLLQELGATSAHVYAAGGNAASTALYPAAGFVVSDLNDQWRKVCKR
ncbi:MAG TPA: GNAT family N-acetyltransferase [Chloroflexi bacterium]|nr:GNAT family N-acetyltransferase [Chloroflexota bacterium]